MPSKRDGERSKLTDIIEAVVYSELGVPGFANEFEINFGGMRFNASIDYKCGEPVVAHLFLEGKAFLDLKGKFLRREDDGTSIVKFDPLSNKQREILNQILEQEMAPSLAS